MKRGEERGHGAAWRPSRRPPSWFDRHAIAIAVGATLFVLAVVALQVWLRDQSPDARAADAARKVDLATFEVYLHRQGCPTRCPVYAVLVRGSGLVQYEGVEFVARIGPERSTVTELEARALALAVLRAGLGTAPAQFKPGSAACERWDHGREQLRIGAKLGAETWTVDYYPGCVPGDPKLEQLAREIDALANTARWVKGA